MVILYPNEEIPVILVLQIAGGIVIAWAVITTLRSYDHYIPPVAPGRPVTDAQRAAAKVYQAVLDSNPLEAVRLEAQETFLRAMGH
jgi:hypothetical protein